MDVTYQDALTAIGQARRVIVDLRKQKSVVSLALAEHKLINASKALDTAEGLIRQTFVKEER